MKFTFPVIILLMQVFIIVSITSDGFIAQNKEQNSLDWTSKEDKQFFMRRTKEAGVIVMGSTTFATIEVKYKPLKDRLNIVYTRQKTQDFVQQGEWANDPSRFRTFSGQPQALIDQLSKEGFTQLAVCGGASTYSTFLQAGVVDKIYLTVEPILFGDGVKLFNQAFWPLKKLSLVKTTQLNQQGTLLLEYNLLK